SFRSGERYCLNLELSSTLLCKNMGLIEEELNGGDNLSDSVNINFLHLTICGVPYYVYWKNLNHVLITKEAIRMIIFVI
ncbi:hypothetical protein Avbf_18464, partial [Armadillidium vulgare]